MPCIKEWDGSVQNTHSSNRHHRAAKISMERNRHHVAASYLNGAAQAERSGTYLGGAATGVTYQDGVVWDDGGSVQICDK